MRSKPVWIWLPNQTTPVHVGMLTRETATTKPVATFDYSREYASREGAIPLDQGQLSKFNRTARTADFGGLFGVMRDVRPEGFGLDMLSRKHQIHSLDDLDALEVSIGDAVGALEVCEDIESKAAFTPPSSQQMFEIMETLSPGQSNTHVVTEIIGMHGTSLGGERPKITVMHEGQQWISKFAGSRDDPKSTLREYLAMKIAALCDIDVAPVQHHTHKDRSTVLVKRFDRNYDASGRLTRQHFASAATVLGYSASQVGSVGRTYANMAMQAARWGCRDHKQQLWKRMAFNVIVGNGDDHPRNHGFLFGADGWTLSPAYDIAPYSPHGGKAFAVHALSLGILPSGESGATARNLLLASKLFDVPYEEATSYLESTFEKVSKEWDVQAQLVDQEPIEKPCFILPSRAEWPTQEDVRKHRHNR